MKLNRFTLVGLAALAALALFPADARAHGGVEHVMGKVKAVDEKSITVETKGGKEVTASIDESTRFEKAGAAATAKDVAAGERVVVHAKKTGDSLTAIMVKIGGKAGGHHEKDHGSGPDGEHAHDK